MALRQEIRTKTEWLSFFIQAGIPNAEADSYATIFSRNRITEITMNRIDTQTLTDLQIEVLGDRLAILQHIQTHNSPPMSTMKPVASATAKPPVIHNNMTHAQFRKFKVDWNVYKQLTSLPPISRFSLHHKYQLM